MDFFLIFCVFVIAIFMFFGSLFISYLLAPHRPYPEKNAPYECGEKQIGAVWVNFNVGYYLFALLFLAFEVEAAFLFPWAVIAGEAGISGLIGIGIFVSFLVLGLIYAWRKGALEWV